MAKRELFGVVAIPILIVIIFWLPAWGLLAVIAAATVLAAKELLDMAVLAEIPCGRVLPLLALLGLLLAAWFADGPGLLVALVAVVLLMPTLQLAHSERPRNALSGAAVACFGVLFLGVGGACLGWLRLWAGDALGPPLVLLFLAIIWGGDSGAYYVGKNLGRHPMAPRISPKKTWEGLAGGVAGAFLIAALAKVILTGLFGWQPVLIVAAILAVVAPLGDLIESQFKRATGVKDSSNLIPGHGGFLDRTDSLLYSAPPILGYLLLADLLPGLVP